MLQQGAPSGLRKFCGLYYEIFEDKKKAHA
jgi:hypothetical protein